MITRGCNNIHPLCCSVPKDHSIVEFPPAKQQKNLAKRNCENTLFLLFGNLRPVEFEHSLIHQSRVIKSSSCVNRFKKKILNKFSSPYELMVESSSLKNSCLSPKKIKNFIKNHGFSDAQVINNLQVISNSIFRPNSLKVIILSRSFKQYGA